ncbi:TSL-kinase interacting protein [Orobanche hederae]
MVTQVSLLDCELCHSPDNLGNKDGDSNMPSSSQENAATEMPVKKQTRRWAAWTRQEEESFFAALRQVGKNFEKITCRVQSKNKDQSKPVPHGLSVVPATADHYRMSSGRWPDSALPKVLRPK